MAEISENNVAKINHITVQINHNLHRVTTAVITNNINLKVEYIDNLVHTTTKRKVHSTQDIPCNEFQCIEPQYVSKINIDQ